jgi:hypothetical protein
MNKKNILITLSAAVLILLIIVNYGRIIYLNDLIRAEMTDLFDPLFHKKKFNGEAGPGRISLYNSTFRGLSGEFRTGGHSLFFIPEETVRIRDLAETIIEKTEIYTAADLTSALKKANSLNGETISPGEAVYIPNTMPLLAEDPGKRMPAAMISTIGLYFSGHTAGTAAFFRSIPELKKAGINAVVFDVKDVTGIVTYRSRVPLAVKLNTHDKRSIHNLPLLLREMKKHGIYSIARLSVFHDQLLASRAPSLAIRSASTGGPWRASPRELWCDPTNKTVQQYNIDLAVEAARLGADEIQFDYIRFPTSGNFSDARFTNSYGNKGRDETITGFLKRAGTAVKKAGAAVSIDIFGVVAWGKEADIKNTGQRIELLAPHCDAISPMLYPSHFNDDFDGYAKPGDNPYYFINAGCRKVASLAGGKSAVRPWLQAFKWRVSRYDEKYIYDQIKGSNDAGARGYLFWNASNDYRVVFRALSAMKTADRGKQR